MPIYVQRSEHEGARQPNYTVPSWVDFPDAEYAVIDGDAQIAQGVHILRTPGHTVGHQSVVVETRSGPVVLAGQAVYSEAEYDEISDTRSLPTDGPDNSDDLDTYLASALRLVDQAPRRVHFSHDGAVWTAAAVGP